MFIFVFNKSLTKTFKKLFYFSSQNASCVKNEKRGGGNNIQDILKIAKLNCT